MKKVALVTGSTNNVGKGIAETLSKDGYLVIITSRHESAAKEVSEYLDKKGGWGMYPPLHCDFANLNPSYFIQVSSEGSGHYLQIFSSSPHL